MCYFGLVEWDPSHINRDFPAAAEYLSNIHLIKRDYGVVTNARLAEWIGVSTSAVTQAISRLKKLGLVEQKKYEHIELTPLGREAAVTTLRRHYLLEHLLVKVLGFPWHKADEEAKVLQNQISDDLADHLDERLGHPQTCPHGNPMPGAAIEAKLLSAPRLSEARAGEEVLILRVTEEGEALGGMLEFCQREGIRPGARFKIVECQHDFVRVRGATGAAEDPAAEGVIPKERAIHIRYEAS